jgi:glycerate 2-kinase
VLVSPTAFKGTFRPRQVAEALAAGVRRASPDARVLECAVSDGGDGLVDVLLGHGAFRETLEVVGPLGDPVQGEIGWRDGETAVIESASACGLALVPVERRDPLRATSRGVGQLVGAARDRGARTIVVGLGGTATVDGGTGMARAWGWTFSDGGGKPLPEGGGSLADLAQVSAGWRLEVEVVGLTDVTNPLLGPLGAAQVFGPQKGADAEQVKVLERGLGELVAWASAHGLGADVGQLPGAGAAGGLGAGIVWFAKGRLESGAEWVLSQVGFDAALARADLVITGEGMFDRTSLFGKATGEVVRRAQAARKQVGVVAGRVSDPPEGVVWAAGDAGGGTLSVEDLTALAARVTATAFGLPGA